MTSRSPGRRSPFPALAAFIATVGTSLSLGSLLSGAWLSVVTLSALSAVVGAELARRLRAPRPLVPLAGLVTLGLFLTAHFARDDAVAGFLPSLSVVDAFRALVHAGIEDVSRSTAPVTVTTGLLFLTAAGVGLVALLVDTRAVTYGGAGLAALPLLALYAVPSFLAPDGATARGFLVGASGYLLLLHLDRRDLISGWGRVIGRTPGAEVPLGRPGPGVLAFGVAVPVTMALLLPVAAPFLSHGILDGARPGGGRDRMVHTTNPVVNLQDDLLRGENVRLMTYRTSDNLPKYIRVVGLDEFKGELWDTSRLQVKQTQQVNKGMELQNISAAHPSSVVRTTFDVGPYETQWLPLPYPATRVDTDDSWLYDKETYNVFSTERSTRGLTYQVDSLNIPRDPDSLRAAGPPGSEVQRFLQLPDTVPFVVRVTAAGIKQRYTNDYDRAVAMESMLRTFQYNPHAPDGTGNTALERFFRVKSGFCVHFASAMAVMAREMGIPSRVAVGFLPRPARPDGVFEVTSHDAHAWPELYFAGHGWVAFEPTPPARAARPTVTETPEPTTSETSSPQPTNSTGSTTPSARPTGRRAETGAPAPAPASTPPGGFGKALHAVGLPAEWAGPVAAGGGGTAALLALSLTPLLAATLIRRRRWRSAAESPSATARAALEQWQADCRDFGLPWRPNETPRQFGRQLANHLGAASPAGAAVIRLTAVAERFRYAPDLGTLGDPAADVRLVRDELATRTTFGGRLRARWLPPSVLTSVAAMVRLRLSRLRRRTWAQRTGATR